LFRLSCTFTWLIFHDSALAGSVGSTYSPAQLAALISELDTEPEDGSHEASTCSALSTGGGGPLVWSRYAKLNLRISPVIVSGAALLYVRVNGSPATPLQA